MSEALAATFWSVHFSSLRDNVAKDVCSNTIFQFPHNSGHSFTTVTATEHLGKTIPETNKQLQRMKERNHLLGRPCYYTFSAWLSSLYGHGSSCGWFTIVHTTQKKGGGDQVEPGDHFHSLWNEEEVTLAKAGAPLLTCLPCCPSLCTEQSSSYNSITLKESEELMISEEILPGNTLALIFLSVSISPPLSCSQ